MDLLSALATIEQMCLDVLKNRKEHTARFIGRDVPVGAGNTLGDSSYGSRYETASSG